MLKFIVHTVFGINRPVQIMTYWLTDQKGKIDI